MLDIGCGWGGFARFAAERYHCHVTGITILQKQIDYAKAFCEGLPASIMLCDYRDVEGSFSKILICGMIEHVGYKNYRRSLEIVSSSLQDNGLFLLHTIGRNTSTTSTEDLWIKKYIFTNGMLPSIQQLASATEGLFGLEDLHNFGSYYDPTLMAWHNNFIKNGHRTELLLFFELCRRISGKSPSAMAICIFKRGYYRRIPVDKVMLFAFFENRKRFIKAAFSAYGPQSHRI